MHTKTSRIEEKDVKNFYTSGNNDNISCRNFQIAKEIMHVDEVFAVLPGESDCI
jgi:hypothetical protein